MLFLKIIIISFFNNHLQHYALFKYLLIFNNLFLIFIAIVNLFNFLGFKYFISSKLFVNLIFYFEQLFTYLLLSFMILFFNLLF
jgi:hypothetical protein